MPPRAAKESADKQEKKNFENNETPLKPELTLRPELNHENERRCEGDKVPPWR